MPTVGLGSFRPVQYHIFRTGLASYLGRLKTQLMSREPTRLTFTPVSDNVGGWPVLVGHGTEDTPETQKIAKTGRPHPGRVTAN